MKTWNTNNGYRITRVIHRRSNVFLISNNDRHILVDSNLKRHRKLLDTNLRKLGITKLDVLILTHTHFDHAGNAAYIQKKYRPKVIVHQSESAWLHDGNSPLPHGSFFITRLIYSLFSSFVQRNVRYESCLPDFEVLDNFSLADFGINGYIVHTPGHSPGMMCVIVDNDIALVGDAMINHIPGTIFPSFAEDTDQLILSWGRLLDSNCRLFLPAHGEAIEREKLLRHYNKRINIS